MAEDRAVTPEVRRFWLVAGWAWVALIIWGSLTPSPPDIEPSIFGFDKVEHFGAYLLITAWFAAAYPRRMRWFALAFAVLGGLIEILQGYTGRDAEWLDWAADCAGVAAGLWYPARWLARLRLHLADRHARRA